MATKTVQDYRRTDLRTNVLANPYWISSGLILGTDDIKDKYSVLFSFPVVESIIVMAMCCQIITAFSSGTTLDVGTVTLATDAVTTGGVATTVDDDDFIANAGITATTAGMYWPTSSDFITAVAAGTYVAPALIVGAAATVPAIAVLASNAGTISAGVARIHALITKIPR